MAPKILVVIVTYNAMRWAERCFASLTSSSIKPDVFVVDNGSTDGTQQYVRENYPEIIIKQSKINLGFGQANNIGLRYAVDHNYEYVYLLNQDAWILSDTIENMVGCFEGQPEYGILSPIQMSEGADEFDRNFLNHTCRNLSLFTEDLFFSRVKSIYPVSHVMAAHWLISVQCIKKVGGFSPTFHQYGEDDNYIDRVLFWGMKIGITPSAKAIHARKYREQTRSQFFFHHFYKYYLVLLSQPRLLSISVWIKMLISTILSVIKYRSLVVIRYTLQLIMESRKIRHNRQESMQSGAFL